MPRFLFDYIDGGAKAEQTLRANISDLHQIQLDQRVLQPSNPSLKIELFGHQNACPIIFAPIGINGMYAKQDEVHAALAAAKLNVPYTLSTVSV